MSHRPLFDSTRYVWRTPNRGKDGIASLTPPFFASHPEPEVAFENVEDLVFVYLNVASGRFPEPRCSYLTNPLIDRAVASSRGPAPDLPPRFCCRRHARGWGASKLVSMSAEPGRRSGAAAAR